MEEDVRKMSGIDLAPYVLKQDECCFSLVI